jgi:hypothetical protein
MKTSLPTVLLLTLLCQGCRVVDGDADDGEGAAAPPVEARAGDAAPLWRIAPPPTSEDLRAARRDTSWRIALRPDSTPDAPLPPATIDTDDDDAIAGGATPRADTAAAERFDDIGATNGATGGARASAGPPALALPVTGDAEGPSSLRAQILLDLALFSPGVADGRWNANAQRALAWFQRREGIPATGSLDRSTLDRLWQAAGSPDTLVGTRVLTARDVEGPFVTLPDDVYRKAEMECLCYGSLSEKLAELAHTTPDVLTRLNPSRDLDALVAGDSVRVPLLGRFAGDDGATADSAQDADTVGGDRPATGEAADSTGAAMERRVARLVISDQGRYLHGLDAGGRILFHVPATLGSDYFPSPSGAFQVASIHRDPWFHYQPALLEGVDADEPNARLAPGPNSPVGEVWIALSKEHYGIHGTDAPETIGFVTSSGCVRLTNWDARMVAAYVESGTPVEFRDVERAADSGESNGPNATPDSSRRRGG